ncbi:response regulator [candidate division KSB1 bacterium]|nr:response regulator [candidate division KSB1 bacterium]
MNLLSMYHGEERFSATSTAKSVVIVSDDPEIIHQLEELLTPRDYVIIKEESRLKSVRKILEQEIDFLILDLDYPIDASIDLIDIIKRTRPRLPIVVLSDNNSLEAVRKLSEAGVFYCAFKPIQIGEVEKVFEALERMNSRH